LYQKTNKNNMLP